MDKEILNRMKSIEDDEYYFAIIDCPKCGMKDVPINRTYIRQGVEYVPMVYCLNCHLDPGDVKPKGYISLIELEEMEWDIEL